MLARHGTRGPYGLRQDHPSTLDLRPYAPNRSFVLDRTSWGISEWEGLTERGAAALRELAAAEWRRYQGSLLDGLSGARLCERLAATPDSDKRNLESNAHFLHTLVSGGAAQPEPAAVYEAAAHFDAPIGGARASPPAAPCPLLTLPPSRPRPSQAVAT